MNTRTLDAFIDTIKRKIKDFNKHELRALAYMCIYNKAEDWSGFLSDDRNIKKAIESLTQKNIIRYEHHGYYDSTYTINPFYYLYFAAYFAKEKEIALSITKKPRYDKPCFLWNLTNIIVNPQESSYKRAVNSYLNTKSSSKSSFSKIEEYLLCLFLDWTELLLPILPYLKPDDIHKTLNLHFDYISMEYKLTEQNEAVYRHALTLLKEGSKARYDMEDKLNYLVFLQNGCVSKPSGKKHSLYSLSALAIKELYEGKAKESYSHFKEAISLGNKSEVQNGHPKNEIIAYYSILAAKLSLEATSFSYLDDFESYPFSVLSESLGKDMSEKLSESLAKDKKLFDTYYIIELLTYLHQDLTPNVIESRCDSICNALQNELAPWSETEGISKLKIQSYEDKFGGGSIISRIDRKPEWLVYMEGLTGLIHPKSSTNDNDNKKSRIGYFIKNNDRAEVRVQTRLKNGEWSSGRVISAYFLGRNDYEGVDNVDLKIAEGASYYYSDIALGKVLPFLVGSDRVYYGHRMPYQKVEIVESTPYIEVKKTKNGDFKIGSNVTYSMLTNIKSEYSFNEGVIKKQSDTLYEIIKLNKIQRNILLKLCEKTELPKQSESFLTQTLSTLSPFIEIHSDLLEGGSSLESIEGDSRIIIQLNAFRANSIKAEMMVKPIEGSRKCIPGKGDKNIYETIDGKRVMIVRSLSEEKAAYAQLLGFLQEDLECEVDDQQCILDYEQMLELLEWSRDHQDAYIIEWNDAKKISIAANLDSSNMTLRVSSSESWFDIEGEVQINQDNISLIQLLDLLNSEGTQYGRFIRINDEQYVSLSQKLRKQLDRLAASSQKNKTKLAMSQYNVGVLADILNDDAINANPDADIHKRLALIEEAASLEPDVPSTLNADLRQYQYEGFKWMCQLAHWGGGGCLADDMGLGKTLQAIAFMLYRADKGPSLVVAPSSVVLNWQNEFARFAPTMSIKVLNITQNREALLSDLHNQDVVLCTYGILSQDVEMIQKVNWNVICLDEAHTIKNRQTKMSAAAMSLHSQTRIILTGTPIQNYLGELWNLFQFLNPGMLGSFEAFSAKYITKLNPDLKSLKKILSPFILRRTKKEVLNELPEKTEMVRMVELDDVELAYYESARQRVLEELEGETKVSVNVLAEITKLRQAACSLSLINKDWNQQSSKTKYFVEVLENIISGGNSALVFSQFTSYLGEVCAALDAQGIKYLYLDGATTVKKRKELVDRFQNGECQVFVISLKAGGLGLNLTRANYVLHLDPWWNPAIEQQATDRSYRIGQKENVTVFKFISSHTIEEKILRLHKSKKALAETFLEGHSQAKALSIEELRGLVDGSE